MTRTLRPISELTVPEPRPSDSFQRTILGNTFQFRNLKHLLGAADFSKAGDRNAGLASDSEVERETARGLLSDLTLQYLYDSPLTDHNGEVDSVMRVNYDLDELAFDEIASLRVGELKDRLLKADEVQAKRIGSALTGVMAAAVAKLLDTHELILIAKKFERKTQARTLLGTRGTLSSRLQPNHPIDDVRGISLLIYAGLSMGSGDALIGVNPAIDTVENIAALLTHLDKLRRRIGAPTQICVLSHVKTQMACLKKGAPVEVMFQSLAGTESTNLTEFDVSVELLDEAYHAMAELGPLRQTAQQFLYFETGQGSEYTYGKHNGIDMATLESLCYGLARRYDPFMVNNVTGFIGPETHVDNFEMILSNLQDHFMGKLLGLPMGMAPCYTLHSQITLEGQQMATQMLTAAGANYYMDVCLNTDRMLAYFDTSAHDNQTLREVHGKQPAPEFLEWAVSHGIFRKDATGNVLRGPNWGNPRIFCESDSEFQELVDATPSLHGFENAGPRPADHVSRDLRCHQAVGRAAIQSDLDLEQLGRLARFRLVKTKAQDREAHLNSPELGARLCSESKAELAPEHAQIQVVVSDGLSAEAVHHNIEDLFPVLHDGLTAQGIRLGQPMVAPFGRVKLAEDVAATLNSELVLLLIGERPGGNAEASRSLSCYFTYQLLDPSVQREAANFSKNADIRFEYSVVSNIYSKGLPPLEAGSVLTEKAITILAQQAAGNRLEAILAG